MQVRMHITIQVRLKLRALIRKYISIQGRIEVRYQGGNKCLNADHHKVESQGGLSVATQGVKDTLHTSGRNLTE